MESQARTVDEAVTRLIAKNGAFSGNIHPLIFPLQMFCGPYDTQDMGSSCYLVIRYEDTHEARFVCPQAAVAP
jgi:hypothetical protein